MTHPYQRPCFGGSCTEKGMSTPGFCRCRAAADEIAQLRATMEWIIGIADANYEQDEKLRSQGARTLKRISDRARAALKTALETKP